MATYVLNKQLSTDPSIDTIRYRLVKVIVDVSSTEPEGRATRVDVEPVVVCVSNGDNLVFCALKEEGM